MTDLTELSRRVSEADGPSRELDAEIWLALDPRNTRKQWSYVHEATGRTCEVDETWDATRRLIIVPAYTASLDAVATLIAEKLPEDTMISMAWRRSPLTAGAYVMPSRCNAVDGAAKTPALALLSAALLAIHERNKSDE